MATNVTPTISVRLLGNFELTIDGTPVRRWRAGKARSLFQYLLVHRDRVVLRDKLYEVLWPETPWTPNSSSLKVAMHALRQILQVDPDGTDSRGLRIMRQDFGYVLHADRVWVDVDEFESRVTAGRMADGDGDVRAALAEYAAAMEIYQGDFLAGDSADWIIEQREWCKALALRALDRLCTCALRRGALDEVLHWCRIIISLDPYHEATYQLLMSVHGSLGELGTVRRWHDICVRRLRDELDVAPNIETGRIYHRALRGELRHSLPRAQRMAGVPVVTPMAGRGRVHAATDPAQRHVG
ncbi:AfsR/SARP family transcriptional regulator [Kutzneria chonburiensis]|uniref:BTAD domain-containing putative transcriptional regulator n=1 Tax=Kutzneria chonburiensis TaxID=1483604 RepID=A0ABV6ML03_9PSEU|nr:BTAD domain-containing putative transcriptional regulator [Kutzneria chonburiensis]